MLPSADRSSSSSAWQACNTPRKESPSSHRHFQWRVKIRAPIGMPSVSAGRRSRQRSLCVSRLRMERQRRTCHCSCTTEPRHTNALVAEKSRDNRVLGGQAAGKCGQQELLSETTVKIRSAAIKQIDCQSVVEYLIRNNFLHRNNGTGAPNSVAVQPSCARAVVRGGFTHYFPVLPVSEKPPKSNSVLSSMPTIRAPERPDGQSPLVLTALLAQALRSRSYAHRSSWCWNVVPWLVSHAAAGITESERLDR